MAFPVVLCQPALAAGAGDVVGAIEPVELELGELDVELLSAGRFPTGLNGQLGKQPQERRVALVHVRRGSGGLRPAAAGGPASGLLGDVLGNIERRQRLGSAFRQRDAEFEEGSLGARPAFWSERP